MTTVKILQIESTTMGDMVDLMLDVSVVPAPGMILMDEESQTWEITALLHDSKRNTGNDIIRKRWTFQCKPVNADKPIQPGEFKLLH